MGSTGITAQSQCNQSCSNRDLTRLLSQEDGLQWVIDECYKTHDPKQLEPARVTHRLLILNLVSIHSTSFTTTNTILDLYSSPPSSGFVDGLREECDRALADSHGIWTKDALNKLSHVDSTIRESMRFSSFGIVALPRRVSSPHPNIHSLVGITRTVPTF